MESPNSKLQTLLAFIVLSHFFVMAICDDRQEFLDEHNKIRQQFNEPPYVWDDQLAKYATEYADKRKGDCKLVHSGGPYGENLFWGGGDKWTATDAVRMWVGEHEFYNDATSQCAAGKVCGHYVQVVWRDSTHLGCTRSKCNNGDIFTICSYGPPGNYEGEIPYNHYDHST